MSNKKPVSGTGEWAAHTMNIQNGCEHDCRYCYAKTQAIRFGKNTADGWKTPVLNEAATKRKFGKKKGTIMFPTTHDITPLNVGECSRVLQAMLKAGNRVLIVSKPHLECVRRLCGDLADYKDLVLFRFTIGSTDDAVLSFWEPNAPKFSDRLKALQLAYDDEFQTSVSCEPMLDANISAVVEEVYPYITDAIWIGKPNKLMLRASMNNNGSGKVVSFPGVTLVSACEKLLAICNDEFIWRLYRKYEDDPMIKWKDSIKQVVGLDRPTVKGTDQ